MRMFVPETQLAMPELFIGKSVRFELDRPEAIALDTYAGLGATAMQLSGYPTYEPDQLESVQESLQELGGWSRLPIELTEGDDEPLQLVTRLEDIFVLRNLVEKGVLAQCLLRRTPLSALNTAAAGLDPVAVRVYQGLDVAAAYSGMTPGEARRNFIRYNRNPQNPNIRRLSSVAVGRAVADVRTLS